MKRIAVSIVLILLPLIMLEVILRIPPVSHFMYDQSMPSELTSVSSDGKNWPDMLIMGSSIARGDIDDVLLKDTLSKQDISVNIGHIGVSSDQLSNDYFVLRRILKECNTCPKYIVYVATDLALRSNELDAWEKVSVIRLNSMYDFSPQARDILLGAARLDPSYQLIVSEVLGQSQIRTVYWNRILLRLINNALSTVLGNKSTVNQTVMRTQQAGDPGYGYWPYVEVMTEVGKRNSIQNYRKHLRGFHIGGSGVYFMDKYLELAQKHDIKMFIVIPPLTDVYQTSFQKEVGEFHSYLSGLTKRDGVYVIDGMNCVSEDYRYYSDTNHLNKFGAQLFTPKLASVFSQIWNQTDRKNITLQCD